MGEGEDGICLLHIDPQTTFTLKEFVDVQTRQAQDATEKLTALRVKVLEIVKEACEVGLNHRNVRNNINLVLTSFR